MTLAEIAQTVVGILVALGGGSAIVLFAGSWLGRVWANRILETDRARYSRELEGIRTQAQHELALLSSQLEVARQTELRIHSDKLSIYRAAVDIVAGLIRTLEKHETNTLGPAEGLAALDQFSKGRLQLYGYLGMLAPQAVMDAQDALMDYLLAVIGGERESDWGEMRKLVLVLLNEIRIDIGIDKSAIEYRGAR